MPDPNNKPESNAIYAMKKLKSKNSKLLISAQF